MSPESSNAARIGASEMECKMELKMEEMTLMGVRKMSEEVGACREKEDNSVILPATTINFKEKKISEDSSKIEIAQLVTTRHIKWKTIVPFYPPLQSTLRRRKYRKTVQKLRQRN
jgi:hypothetical protein